MSTWNIRTRRTAFWIGYFIYRKYLHFNSAVKHSIATGAGVIDEDYRGPVKVLLFNHSEKEYAGTIISISKIVFLVAN
jgi:dUTPase